MKLNEEMGLLAISSDSGEIHIYQVLNNELKRVLNKKDQLGNRFVDWPVLAWSQEYLLYSNEVSFTIFF